MNRLPDFVIIGAAKSASTWLHMSLREHPAVYMPVAESAFFEDPYYRENDLGPLYAEVKDAPRGALLGVKCPNYLCTPECAPRLFRVLPHSRLIALLRNPVDRAISQYYHLMRSGQLPVRPADDAFEQYLAGRFEPAYARKVIMDFGLYGMGIDNFRSNFPPQQLLILTDLDMRRSSAEVFRRVCDFLDIEQIAVPKSGSVPRNQGVYFLPLLSFIQRMSHFGQSYDPITNRAVLRPGFRGWAARQLALYGSRLSGASRTFVRPQAPQVSVRTRAALLEFYLPDILKLEALTQLDLSAWKSPQPEVVQ